MTVDRGIVFLLLSLFALRLHMFVGLMHTFLCWRYLSGFRSILYVSRLKITVPHVSVRLLVFSASFNSFIKFSCNLCADFFLQFMYFNLNYSFLFFNSTGVGFSILSNFTNIFNHFFHQMLDFVEPSWYFHILVIFSRNTDTHILYSIHLAFRCVYCNVL